MPPPPAHVQTIAREIARLRADLAALLAAGTTTAPRMWASASAEFDRLASDLLWCRDGALVVARRNDTTLGRPLPWHVLEDLTGVSDSTLSDRYAAFLTEHHREQR